MRQRRWLELIKDYDCTINYHSEKANVVANALNRNFVEGKERSQKMSPDLEKDMESNGIELLTVDEGK